jgi:hypothetical protein
MAPVAPRPGMPRQHRAPRTHRAPMAEAPRAPWSPLALVGLCVVVAIVLIVAGLLTDGPRRGALLACGVALGSLAGLELAHREHLAGFRSESALLAGAGAVLLAVPLLLLTGLPQIALVAIGAAVFGLGFVALRRGFQARTGGIGFRV